MISVDQRIVINWTANLVHHVVRFRESLGSHGAELGCVASIWLSHYVVVLFNRLGKLLVLQGKVLDGLTLSLTLILAGNLGLGAGLATYSVWHRFY